MFFMQKTLDYLLVMHKEEFWANQWNKTSQNHIAKEIFLGRTQRRNEEHSTWTQQHGSQTRLDMGELKAYICWKSCNDQ